MEKHRRIEQYQDRYLGDYGFEATLVAARQRLLLEVLRKSGPRVVLEVGCGIDMLGARAQEAGLAVEQWIIVEPSERFFNAACALNMGATRVDAIRGFFEDATDAIRSRCMLPPDLIICSGLLNEVEQPQRILAAARSLLSAEGILHVNVPNAHSLHRRLARAMGLIRSEQELTQRNRRLAQYRVYDFDSLIRLMEDAGLRVFEKGGYFLKPFTHAQMESLSGLLSESMIDGLWQIGRELPDLASEIYVNVQVA